MCITIIIDMTIKQGDIFQYTTDIGGHKKYYIEEVYEATDEWMVIFSWEDDEQDTGWSRVVRPLKGLLEILQSGHIKITGTDEHKPITYTTPHTFNPTLRNIPIIKGRTTCPYRTPKLYEWK